MIFTCDSHHSDDVTPGKALRSMRCHAGQVCSLARGECSARCAPQSEMLPPPVTLREEGCSQPSPMLAMKKNISKTKLITDDSVPEGEIIITIYLTRRGKQLIMLPQWLNKCRRTLDLVLVGWLNCDSSFR